MKNDVIYPSQLLQKFENIIKLAQILKSEQGRLIASNEEDLDVKHGTPLSLIVSFFQTVTCPECGA